MCLIYQGTSSLDSLLPNAYFCHFWLSLHVLMQPIIPFPVKARTISVFEVVGNPNYQNYVIVLMLVARNKELSFTSLYQQKVIWVFLKNSIISSLNRTIRFYFPKMCSHFYIFLTEHSNILKTCRTLCNLSTAIRSKSRVH